MDELGITYPQYLVLLVLWETDSISVNDIAKKLILKTNTLTPLLKRMEQLGLIHRTRSKNDERKVIVNLSSKGRELREKAVLIPEKLITRLSDGQLSIEKLIELKNSLTTIISFLSK
ncbi:MarR family winged helix-turn-helix transcriptional regulator [Saccharicrinis fermentans]|uniref:MarR family winged helix-turn-helix transcriptional regulator n=1 Tax=Saccharicrinis fermentans TaxID=982 RepID=UPI001FD1D072|nr:MarR family transcriptional regulator [Saccharicrinis fermentans]